MTKLSIRKNDKIRPDRIVQMIAAFAGGGFRPSDDDDRPVGPWGPVIRSVFDAAPTFSHEVGHLAGAFGRFGLAALNPQPLPPRFAYVAALGHAAVLRAELIGELSAELGDRAGSAQTRGASRYLSDLLDDWCGTPPRPFPWPWPGPRPEWAREALGAIDHVILASAFQRAAAAGIGGELGNAVKAAHRRLAETATEALTH